MSLADPSTASSLAQVDVDAAKWMGLAEAWLGKRFALSLPAQPAWMAAMEADAPVSKEALGANGNGGLPTSTFAAPQED